MSTLTKENTEKLAKLARFLWSLPPKVFSYGNIVYGTVIPTPEFTCGTVACAFGYTPLVFPEAFEYKADPWVSIHYKGGNTDVTIYNWSEVASDFFGIPENEVLGLFSPGDQHCIEEQPLSPHATAREVASLIVRFVSQRSYDISPTLP